MFPAERKRHLPSHPFSEPLGPRSKRPVAAVRYSTAAERAKHLGQPWTFGAYPPVSPTLRSRTGLTRGVRHRVRTLIVVHSFQGRMSAESPSATQPFTRYTPAAALG